MRARLFCALTLLLFSQALSLAPAHATVVFYDGFDAEPGTGDGASGLSGEGYTGFAQWTVASGTVDLVAQADFAPDPGQILCVGGAGKCVDLDGNTLDAGVLTSISIALAPGLYDFTYSLSGTASSFTLGNSAIPNVVDVAIAGFYATTHTLYKGDPYQVFGGQFSVVSPTSVTISFANQGGDNFGAVLDEVRLTLVPEPTTALLMGLGLLGLKLSARRARTHQP